MVKSVLMIVGAIFKRFRQLIIAMIVVAIFGTAMLIGLNGGVDSLRKSADNYVKEYNYANGIISTDYNSLVNINDILSVEGVDKVCRRIVFQSVLTTEQGDNSLVGKFSLLTDSDFESFYFYSKDTNINGVYVEKRFAEKNGLKLGSVISTDVLGKKFTLQVSAIITSPECIYHKQNEFSWGNDYSFGYIYVPQTVWESYLGKSEIFNQFRFLTKNGYDDKVVMDSVIDEIGADCVKDSQIYENSEVKKVLDISIKPVRDLIPV